MLELTGLVAGVAVVVAAGVLVAVLRPVNLFRHRPREGAALTGPGQPPSSGAPVPAQPLPAPAPADGDPGGRAGAAPGAAHGPAQEQAQALAEALRALVRRANAAGGRLPVGAVPAVRAVEDGLRPLLRYVRAQGASTEEVRQLTAIVTEYLPEAVDRYLALPDSYARTATTSSGRTPAQELVEQLRLLREGVDQLASAVYDSDAQALAVGRRFLDAKFRRSDLDL